MGHTPQKPKTNRTIISPLSDPQERRYTLAETARLLLSVLISAFGFWGIAWLCHRFYQPDITTLIEEGKALLPSHLIDSVRPEPLESLLYNLALLYFPFSLLGLYALFSHKNARRGLPGRLYPQVVFTLFALFFYVWVSLPFVNPIPL